MATGLSLAFAIKSSVSPPSSVLLPNKSSSSDPMMILRFELIKLMAGRGKKSQSMVNVQEGGCDCKSAV